VRNFLVKDLYCILDTCNGEPVDLKNSFHEYELMHQLSIKSFRKNLLGEWTLIELTGDQENIHTCFINTARAIQEIWHTNYPCNILYTNADTLCVHALDIFGHFDEFRMFTEDDPLVFDANATEWQNKNANAGVRYYPSSLDTEFWNNYDAALKNWNFDNFNYDQDAANDIMLKQKNFDWGKKQAWVAKQIGARHAIMINELNNNKFDQAILHFHGSQHPKFRFECMQNLWRKLND
jgi:hypothetical protein